MKKSIFFTMLFFCSIVMTGSAQQRKTPVKLIEPKINQPQTISEFSETEWKVLTGALQREDWTTAAGLAAQYIVKLESDNEKKQLAQLRYFYLYALAGKILNSTTGISSIETEAVWKELDAAISNFAGKEFVLPARRLLPECRQVLNYICAVKDNDRALRVTATNKNGTMIHSFEYVTFEEKVPLKEFAGKELFLGGRLKKVEFNQNKSNVWLMRLFFEKGFASVARAEEKI